MSNNANNVNKYSFNYIAYCSALLMNPNSEPAYKALGAFVIALYHKTHESISVTIEGTKENSISANQPPALIVETVLMCLEDKITGHFLTVSVDMTVTPSNTAEFLVELNEVSEFNPKGTTSSKLEGVFLSPKGVLLKNTEQAVWVLSNEDPIRFGSKLAEKIVSCGLYHLKRTSGTEHSCNKCSSQLVCLSKTDNTV